MKNLIIGLVVAALLIGGIAGASALYKNLSEQYDGQGQGGLVEVTPNGNGGSVNKTEENESTDALEPGEDQSEESESVSEEATESTEEKDSTDDTVIEDTTVEEPTSEETTAEESTEKAEIEFLASDFTVYDENGNAVKLSDFAGKPIVVNFWGTWCPYCKVEMPDFNEAYKSFSDVQFVMVNCGDTMQAAKDYIEAQGFELPILFDLSEIAQYTYSVYSFPTTLFISADGSKVYRATGAIDYETIEYGISLVK